MQYKHVENGQQKDPMQQIKENNKTNSRNQWNGHLKTHMINEIGSFFLKNKQVWQTIS